MNNSTTVFVAIAALVIAIVLVAAIYHYCRWVFSIDKQLKNQAQQIQLLSMIAEKLGVSKTEVESTNPKEEVLTPIFGEKKPFN